MKTYATAGQIKQIIRFGSDAIEKVLDELGLDNTGAQRVIEHGDEFVEAIRRVAFALLKDLSVSDKFKNEKVASKYGYLSGYKPKGITEQITILRELFPDIGYADEKIAEGELPKHTEGWFAIPKWQTIAPTYTEAVEKVLAMLKKTRNGKFHIDLEGQLSLDRLCQSARSVSMFKKLSDEQKDYDILVVPAQFGIRHRGRSVRRAREVFVRNEFGLGAFAVGIMLLTHPERLQDYDDLRINCAGDEYDVGDPFSLNPLFAFDNGEVECGGFWEGCAYNRFGSASGFVPQK